MSILETRFFRHILCLLAISILMVSSVLAQSSVNITGMATDTSGKPVMYATVGLYNKKEGKPLLVAYSSEKGVFKLNTSAKGDLWLLISHGGFTEQWIGVQLGDKEVALGSITMQVVTQELQGVTVTSTKRLITLREDGISYNVENDPMAGSEKALDILRKTPMVSVDGEGKLTVNGQSSFKVLLNGRETAMFARNASEALKNYPGNLIKRIDVITNPSSKYDAEGAAGIINIITHKNVIGYNGSLSFDANVFSMFDWSSNRYAGLNGSFNLKRNKTGFVFNFSLGGNHNNIGRHQEMISPKVLSTFAKRSTDGLLYVNSNSPSGNAEWSYEIDSLQALSIYGSWDQGWNQNTNRNTFAVINPSYTDTVNSSFFSDNKTSNPGWSIGADYIKKFKSSTVKEFSIKTVAVFSDNNTNSNSSQANDDGTSRFILNDSRARDKQYTVQADYIIPVAKGQTLEMGAKTILRRATSDFVSYWKFNAADPYVVNNTNSNFFSYNQEVYSAYMVYRFAVKKINVRTGLRMEHTSLNGNFITSGTVVEQQYTRVLPNVLLSTRLKGGGQLVLSYSQNFRRPYIYSLNPFVNNIDSLNVTSGNPNLDPQLSHVFNFQYQLSKGKTFASISLGYSYSNSFIIYGYQFDKSTGVTTGMPQNGGINNMLFLNMNVNTFLFSKLRTNASGMVSYLKMKSPALNGQQNKGWSGQVSLNNSYTLNQRITINTFTNYYFPVLYLQGQIGGYLSYGFGGRYLLVKNKLTGSFYMNNLFNRNGEMKRINSFSDPAFTTERTSYSRFRGFTLTITWNFGKLSQNVSKKRGVSNNDLL